MRFGSKGLINMHIRKHAVLKVNSGELAQNLYERKCHESPSVLCLNLCIFDVIKNKEYINITVNYMGSHRVHTMYPDCVPLWPDDGCITAETCCLKVNWSFYLTVDIICCASRR